METYRCEQVLPSCTLNRDLLLELEKRLVVGIPRALQKGLRKVLQGLGLEDHKSLESFQITIDADREKRSLRSARELEDRFMATDSREVSLIYRLGAPRIIAIEIVFPRQSRPRISLSSQSPQIGRALPQIAENLSGSIANYRNRNRLLHNSLFQGGLIFSLPTLVMVYGVSRGGDLFLLYASMGWLCLLSLGLTLSLPRVFPWVTFESRRRFQLNRLPLLAKVAVLTVAIACYIGLVLLSVPRTGGQPAVMLAGLVG